MNCTQFIVSRDDFQNCKFIETALPQPSDLPDEALLLRVDRFAFTDNNIAYAMLGDQLYWQLLPAPDGFSNISAWGFGEVVVSGIPTWPQANNCSAISRWRRIW
jgi:hypothetical protein